MCVGHLLNGNRCISTVAEVRKSSQCILFLISISPRLRGEDSDCRVHDRIINLFLLPLILLRNFAWQ